MTFMRIRSLRWAFLLVVLVAPVGCRHETVAPVEEDLENRLHSRTDVDVAAWLKLSRPELVKLTEEWAAILRNDQKAVRNSPDAVDLLPRLCPPLRVPVFRE